MHLQSKIAELSRINEQEKAELENYLRQVIHSHVGMLTQQKCEYSRLQSQLEDYQYTCERQKAEISTLRSTMQELAQGGSVAEELKSKLEEVQKQLIWVQEQRKHELAEQAAMSKKFQDLVETWQQEHHDSQARILQLESQLSNKRHYELSLQQQNDIQLKELSLAKDCIRSLQERNIMLEEEFEQVSVEKKQEIIKLKQNLESTEKRFEILSDTLEDEQKQRSIVEEEIQSLRQHVRIIMASGITENPTNSKNSMPVGSSRVQNQKQKIVLGSDNIVLSLQHQIDALERENARLNVRLQEMGSWRARAKTAEDECATLAKQLDQKREELTVVQKHVLRLKEQVYTVERQVKDAAEREISWNQEAHKVDIQTVDALRLLVGRQQEQLEDTTKTLHEARSAYSLLQTKFRSAMDELENEMKTLLAHKDARISALESQLTQDILSHSNEKDTKVNQLVINTKTND